VENGGSPRRHLVPARAAPTPPPAPGVENHRPGPPSLDLLDKTLESYEGDRADADPEPSSTKAAVDTFKPRMQLQPDLWAEQNSTSLPAHRIVQAYVEHPIVFSQEHPTTGFDDLTVGHRTAAADQEGLRLAEPVTELDRETDEELPRNVACNEPRGDRALRRDLRQL